MKDNPQNPKSLFGSIYSLSPFANARVYFESKKSAESKQIKVEKSTEFALKNAKKKIEQDLNNKLKNENDIF